MSQAIRVPKVRTRKKSPAATADAIPAGMTPYEAFRAAIASMPDEALGWLVVALGRQPVWPDGLGGFRPDSAASIRAAMAAVHALMR